MRFLTDGSILILSFAILNLIAALVLFTRDYIQYANWGDVAMIIILCGVMMYAIHRLQKRISHIWDEGNGSED